MDEQVLVESKRGIFGWICLILFALAVVFVILVAMMSGGDIFNPGFVFMVVIFIVPTGLLALLTSPVELIVTTERVCGRSSWGKKVDLPIDTISSIRSGLLSGIIIGTSSGNIKFSSLSHKEEIYQCISDLLVARQRARAATAQTQMPVPASGADELIKYKNLLDNGIITQEEFAAKKKEILGL